MKFSVKTNEPPLRLGRVLGYKLLSSNNNEYNLVRSLAGNNYPRFHIYVRQERNELIFNLHLDQKKPSYEGTTAHSGEYDGELVEREAERIRKELNRMR